MIRLSKIMADRGLCSRREADEMIRHGLVIVDDEIISKVGTKTRPDAKIVLAPEAISARAKLTTILIKKPPGYVAAQAEKSYIDIRTLVTPKNQYNANQNDKNKVIDRKSLHTAGRLDIDSSGLLVLTQDGAIVRKLIHPTHPISKEYIVRVNGQITQSAIRLLQKGLSLDGRALRPAEVSQINRDQLHFTLREGRKRQIRRRWELVELNVKSLVRVKIGKLYLGDLPRGQWRFMRTDEYF